MICCIIKQPKRKLTRNIQLLKEISDYIYIYMSYIHDNKE